MHDILVLTETNLHEDIGNEELGFTNYNIFRKDRSATTSHKSSGGGVLIAVLSTLRATELHPSTSGIESLFVSLKSSSSSHLLIGGAYIPPQQPTGTYDKYADMVDEILTLEPEHKTIILLGDFNSPETNWADPEPVGVNRSSQSIIEMASTHHLTQINTISNVRGVFLDLIFSSQLHPVVAAPDPLLPVEDAHPAISTSINFELCSGHVDKQTFIDFRRCDLIDVYGRLSRSVGTVHFNLAEPEEFFNRFADTIHETVLSCTPSRIVGRRRFPCWFSADLRMLVIRKKILHKTYKRSHRLGDYNEFSRVRDQCKALSSRCYSDYINGINSSIPSNVKSFWSFVNSTQTGKQQVDEFQFGGRTETDPRLVCKLFADFFSSVFSSTDTPPLPMGQITPFHLSSCVLKQEDVDSKLATLNPNKGAGPDEIPPNVLKYCHALLAPQLTILFNKFLEEGIFPNRLKSSFIVPIHKSSNPKDIKNYRPIAIQPAIGKVFESLVLDQLFFNFKNVFSKEQHGFLPRRSTLTNLILYENYITSAFGDGSQVDSVYIDFAKAFDSVNHVHLISKLRAYGIEGSLLKWFDSYLTNRKLMVKFAGSLSEPFLARSGVPQGSHLGPFLFNIFINDIVDVIETNCLLFADDIKIFCAVRGPEDCQRLRNGLVGIEQWCTRNCMKLNASKCAVITFHRSANPLIFDYELCDTILARKSHIRDLGVIFSNDLRPDNHIDHVCSQAARTLGFIIRSSRNGLSVQALAVLYTALIRPILEYCSVVWAPYQLGNIDRLEKIQRRFLKIIGVRLGFDYAAAPVELIAESLGLASLLTRRKMAAAIFLRKLLLGQIDCSELLSKISIRVPSSTRSQDLFLRQQYTTAYGYHSCLPRIHRIGNMVSSGMDYDFFLHTEAALRKLFLCSN